MLKEGRTLDRKAIYKMELMMLKILWRLYRKFQQGEACQPMSGRGREAGG